MLHGGVALRAAAAGGRLRDGLVHATWGDAPGGVAGWSQVAGGLELEIPPDCRPLPCAAPGSARRWLGGGARAAVRERKSNAAS